MADHGSADHGSAEHGTGPGAAHEPGSMDISNQQETFEGFLNMVKWGMVISILVLIFMALVDG